MFRVGGGLQAARDGDRLVANVSGKTWFGIESVGAAWEGQTGDGMWEKQC